MTITPRAWFAKFDEDSCRDFGFEPKSELGKCKRRYAARAPVQDPERGSDWESHCAEWTAVISLFLAQMAEDCGFVQEWEWGTNRIDFAWFSPNTTVPTILIEHENNPDGIDSRKDVSNSEGEVWKLSRDLSRLLDLDFAVLITYPYGSGKQFDFEILSRVRNILRAERVEPERFLLVLGKVGENEWDNLSWEGVLWKGNDWDFLPMSV